VISRIAVHTIAVDMENAFNHTHANVIVDGKMAYVVLRYAIVRSIIAIYFVLEEHVLDPMCVIVVLVGMERIVQNRSVTIARKIKNVWHLDFAIVFLDTLYLPVLQSILVHHLVIVRFRMDTVLEKIIVPVKWDGIL